LNLTRCLPRPGAALPPLADTFLLLVPRSPFAQHPPVERNLTPEIYALSGTFCPGSWNSETASFRRYRWEKGLTRLGCPSEATHTYCSTSPTNAVGWSGLQKRYWASFLIQHALQPLPFLPTLNNPAVAGPYPRRGIPCHRSRLHIPWPVSGGAVAQPVGL
jgi:hypothetical protein